MFAYNSRAADGKDMNDYQLFDADSAGLEILLSRELDPLFWSPQRLGLASAWWAHVPFAFWVTVASRPRLLVELGTQDGVSYAAFCEAVVRARLGTRCYAVGSWLDGGHREHHGEEAYSDLRDFHDKRYATFSNLLRSPVDDAVQYFENGSIDLLHIDGYHTYGAVKHDYEMWRPKLSDRAIVLVHDTNVRENDRGIHQFFAEISKQFPSFEFPHGSGLGIVAVGAEAAGAVSRLCATTRDEDVVALRERFSHIGQRWLETQGIAGAERQRVEMEEKDAALVALRADLANRALELQELQDVAAGSRAEAAAQRAAFIRARQEAAEADMVVRTTRGEMTTLNEALSRAQQELADRESAMRGDLASRSEPPASTRPIPGTIVQLFNRFILKKKPIALADRARDDREWDVAAHYYRIALGRNPNRPEIWVQLGHVLKEVGRLSSAEEAYRHAIAGAPTLAEPYRFLGDVLSARRKRNDAVNAYLQAQSLDPASPDALSGLRGLGWSENDLAALQSVGSHNLRELGAPLAPEQPATPEKEKAEQRDALAPTDGPGQAQPSATTEPPDGEIAGAAGTATPEVPKRYTGVLPPSPRQFRVLYVSASDTASHHYRVLHYVEALAAVGMDAEWLPAGDYEDSIRRLPSVSLVVLFRLDLSPALSRFIEAAARLRVPTVFDVDDYIFEPEIARPEIVDGIRGWSADAIAWYRSGVRGCREALLSCQFATFTTRFLVERGEELGRRSFLLPNGPDPCMLEFSRELVRRRAGEPDDGLVRMGYAGGTHTHQRDFGQCAEAVAAVLREHPECRLVLFRDKEGAPFLNVDEFPFFQGLDDRIEWRHFVPFEQFPAEIARFDINLAPLELGNPFCEAKSDLKYYEAACLGVPSVASPTIAFSDAIHEGETGFLARSQEDWYKALTCLVRDRSLRERVGTAARERTIETHGPLAQGRAAHKAYNEIIRSYRAGIGRGDGTLTVTLVLDKYAPGSARQAKAIALIRGLSERGHDVALQFPEDDFESSDDIRRTHDLYETVVVTSGAQQLRPCDVVVINSWRRASALKELPGCARAKVYLLQDYEPLYYTSGQEQITAEQSYRLGFHLVSSGPWVRRRVKQEIGVEADWIPFSIDKSVFCIDANVHRSNDRVIVFVRPEIPHRLSELAATAVETFVNRSGFNGSVEFFGSDLRLDLDPQYPHTWHGVLAPQRMAELFREATVGIALSATNTSMVAFEMMACGLPVIDIDYDGNDVSYGGRENVCLLQPDPKSLADGLARLMADAQARELLSENARRFMVQLPDEATVTRQFELLLRSYVGSGSERPTTPSASLAGRQAPVEVFPAANADAKDVAHNVQHGSMTVKAALEPIKPDTAHQHSGDRPLASSPSASGRILPQSTRLRIDWVLPNIEIGSGGIRNILRAAHYLEKFGHDVGLQFNGAGLAADEIKRLIQQHFYPFGGPVKNYDGTFRPADVIIATHWSTVTPALAAVPTVREVMYFVQDYEPYFYPMCTDYILAENTYRLGLYCICSGAWCSRLLRQKFGAASDHFDFPLDRTVYFPRPRQKKVTNVVFFARPGYWWGRRCYGLGVSMLRELHRLMPEVEIVLFGAADIDPTGLDYPVTVRGLLPTLDDLAQMYSDADLGIAFSTTNPSLVPYEMMACGLPIVDIARPGAEVSYGDRSDIAFLASLVPSEMAMQVSHLLRDPAERQARSQEGLRLVSRLPTEEGMAREVERLILTRVASQRPNLADVLRYAGPELPHVVTGAENEA